MAALAVAVGNGARLARNHEKPDPNEVRGTPKFISEKLAQELFANGQVYSQYCTEDGKPTMIEPENPLAYNGFAFFAYPLYGGNPLPIRKKCATRMWQKVTSL